MSPQFIHLRVHTEFSLSDGLIQIEPLIEKACADNMPALALTDQSNVFAAIKFYKNALAAGIKPLLGADIWLENTHEPTHPFRLTLLCQTHQGYLHLLELLSESYLSGQTATHPIPLLTRDAIARRAEGLILLSGAHEGDTGRSLLTGHIKEAETLCHFWQGVFPDRYYLEIRRTGQPHDEPHLQAAVALARKLALPLVATNNVCFLARDDFDAHEARVCIHSGHTLADPRRPKNYSEEQYFRSQQEMVTLFADLPEALENTVEIARRCNVTLTLGKNFLPRCHVPTGFTTETWLAHSAEQGLNTRLTERQCPADQLPTYHTRLTTELDVINRMGFAGYFLIVADFTRWARENGVPVGPGRGSGPGSLVAYALGITDPDPLEHDLLFERFLNPERVSMPDFDIDFCMEGRDRVIDYVIQAHGAESVAQIITYGTMAARAVVRDVGRVLSLPYGFVDKLAKLIPFELGMTLDKAFAQEPLLTMRYEAEDDVRTLMDLARKLEGMTRNVGRHAGGVVIAPEKLTAFTALYCEPGETKHPVTQFDKDDVEAAGLVKFDFLGLRTLTIIDRAIQTIAAVHGDRIQIHRIPIDDPATYALLKACQTTAIFQLESRGMKDLVKRLQPDCFADIVALVALFRPGPLQSGMVDDFINRKHGRAAVSFPHPDLEPILRPTYGVIVYQEQVMQIAQVLAGYSLGAADILRRAMGKKKPEEMAIQRSIFCKGATERGVAAHTANSIFDLMEKFAGYGFNKSHSVSYALIAYQTAWLKAHYPAAYMAAVLSSDMDNTEKVVLFILECRAMGLTVQPPDINQSDYVFRVDQKNKNTLLWGLGAIKGVGENAIRAIIDARSENNPFQNLFDFCARVDTRKLNRRALEALIRAGAFDTIDPNRASLVATLEQALSHAEQHLRDLSAGQQDLFGQTQAVHLTHQPCAPWHESMRLQGEKETLGLYLSGHPINRYLPELAHFTTGQIGMLHTNPGQRVTIAGIISNLRVLQTKRGDRMAIVTLEDETGSIDAICFADTFQTYRELLVKDMLIVATGEMSIDDYSGGMRLTCESLSSIETAREQHAKYLGICLPAEKTQQPHLLEELATLLTAHRGGECPVIIRYDEKTARANLRLGENWRIRPSDQLLEAIQTSLGSHDATEIVY